MRDAYCAIRRGTICETIVTKIKICGITNREDALLAIHLGVDAVGFIFANSPRRVEPEMVRELVELLPPFISGVGVFVDEDGTKVGEIARTCGLTTLQFHGQESASYCGEFRQKVIKAFRIKDKSTLGEATQYQNEVDACLLDTYSPSAHGGTGRVFDWRIATEFKELGLPVILSGGLNHENVEEAIREVRPYGVDVSSGVEERPGKKNPEKLRNFVGAVRRTDESLRSA